MNDPKENKGSKRLKIQVHGLVTYYGTVQARFAVKYLRKYCKYLYAKPIIKRYFDAEWVDYVKNIRTSHGQKFRSLYYLKHPVIIFIDDNYLGDHTSLIEYITRKHGVIPNIPFQDTVPDFTKFLPKSNDRDYAYLEIKIGDGDPRENFTDKLIFELYKDVVPETCAFFSYLCEPPGEYQFSSVKKRSKYSYKGSTIRRVCNETFIQGGEIPDSEDCRVADENFRVKHDRRGIISIANQGGNMSTTEFVICLKPNTWMDGLTVAFGCLVVGEGLLEAIETTPTYYQSPLSKIEIVGGGIISTLPTDESLEFKTFIKKMKQKNCLDVERIKNENKKMLKQMEVKVQDLLKWNEEKKCHISFDYSNVNLKKDSFIDDNLEEMEDIFIFNENMDESYIMGEGLYFAMKWKRSTVIEQFMDKELTVAEILQKSKERDLNYKRKATRDLLDTILEMVYFLVEESSDVDIMRVKDLSDVDDSRDVSSVNLNESFFEKGLYSLPNCLKKNLLEARKNFRPSNHELPAPLKQNKPSRCE